MMIVMILLWTKHPFWQLSKSLISTTFLVDLVMFGWLSFALTYTIKNYFSQVNNYHRIAFILSIGFGIIGSLIAHNTLSLIQVLYYLVFVSFLGFIGSFFACTHASGFWENNEPPSQLVENEVIKAHRNYQSLSKFSGTLKRAFDILCALVSILVSLPVWLLILFLIWWEDPGPVLFVKNAVGRGGKNFKQFKFRSMITNAEKDTGPISGYENDERVLFFGKLIRKTALDELPQLINILRGDMSYVGPRPQRTVLVHQYLQSMPQYAARHQVRPGLAGLAQVADSYHISPAEKLAWDLIYIDRCNIWFDLKLIFAAFLLVFILRWQSNNEPEMVIRKLLNIQKPRID